MSKQADDAGFAHTIQNGLSQTFSIDYAAGGQRVAAAGAEAASSGATRYEVTATIGAGGMGRVLEARDKQFGRIVALKEILDPGLSPEALQRFLLESLVTANLEHPGVPAVHERGVRDGRPFYVMRRLHGRTLGEALAAAGTLEDRLRLLPVLTQVAHTVGYAHERGVVHRDLKPANIIVARHGETSVLDWGIARVRGLGGVERAVEPSTVSGGSSGLSNEASQSATLQGTVMGTPAYMAPEQALGQIDRIDERTDVFALGAMLYELLTGRAPYKSPTTEVSLALASQAKRPPIASVVRRAPAGLIRICEQAMATEPSLRQANGARFAEALEDFQAGAVAGGESRAVKWGAAAITVVATLVLLVTGYLVALSISSIKEQGFSSLVYPTFAVFGLALTTAEWRTRGRYRLAPIALALALVTFLVGLAGTFSGMSMVMRSLRSHDVLADPNQYRAIAASGMFEALGSASASSMLCAAQLFAWFIVARSVARGAEQRRAASA